MNIRGEIRYFIAYQASMDSYARWLVCSLCRKLPVALNAPAINYNLDRNEKQKSNEENTDKLNVI